MSMKDRLEDFSDADLKKELARREEAKKAEIRANWETHANLVEKNVDALLALVPEHSRTSCSDEDPCNPHRGCDRCILLDAKKDGLDPDFTLNIHFERSRL